MNTTVDFSYKIGEVAVDAWNVTSSAASDLWESESVQKGLNATVDMTVDIGSKIGVAATDIWNITSSTAVDLWTETSYEDIQNSVDKVWHGVGSLWSGMFSAEVDEL